MISPLLSPALTVALLGAIESLMSAVVADRMSGDKHNPNVELVAQGIANRALDACTEDAYTDLNNDHAARFTSTSLRVNSCASPAKQRAISEFRWSITGVPRSMAPETAKYWFGIRHRSLAPTAVSASPSLNPGLCGSGSEPGGHDRGCRILPDIAEHERRSKARLHHCRRRAKQFPRD